MIYSLLIDFIWVFFWSSKWGLLVENHEKTIQNIVIIFSWIGIALKIISLLAIGVLETSSIMGSLPKAFQEKLSASNYQEQRDEPGYVA